MSVGALFWLGDLYTICHICKRFPYQNGLLVSYWNTFYEDNSVGEHPGEGLILQASGAPWRTRVQVFDATFGKQRTDRFSLSTAGGEMARTPEDLLRLLREGALDVYQPDVVLSIGMTRCRTIAELALASGRWFTPHTWTDGGTGLLANLHVAAGVGGGPYLEFPYDLPGWTPEARDFLLAEPLDVDADGYLLVPDRPGLGVELVEDIRDAIMAD